jgi:NAD(P)H-hydrate epimerase
LFAKLPRESILTPHIGEFKRFAGNFENSNEKITLQRRISKKYGLNIVLKGPYTTMTDSKGELYINTSGNPGLATAGTGDVLTGIISGLLAQNYTAFNAMISGVFLHGLSADIAVKKSHINSLIASDIIENLSSAFNTVEKTIRSN